MSIRVYALSSELDIPSKQLLVMCKEEGISVKSHASTLTAGEADRLRKHAARQQEAEAAQSQVAPVPEAAAPAADVAPPPLPPRTDPGKLAFTPKRGPRRHRPAQRGVSVTHPESVTPPEEDEAASPAAEVEAPEAAPDEIPPVAEKAPAAEAPAAEVVEDSPVVGEVVATAAEMAKVIEPKAVEDADGDDGAAIEEAPAEAPSPAAAVPGKKPVSIDEFIIEVPKALGRIEGIVPKTIPSKGGRTKPKSKAPADDKKKVEGPAHPQAVGMPPQQVAKAGSKARELANRTVKQATRQTPSQRGIVADTNRPQSGRSAVAGRRRGGRGRGESGDAVEAEARRLGRPTKPGSKTRRDDRVEVDSDIGIIGASNVRVERGEAVRRPFGQRRRRRVARSSKRADQPVVEGSVELEEPITIKRFCSGLGVQASAVIGRLMRRGMMVTVNEVLDTELAEELADEFGVELTVKTEADVEEAVRAEVARSDTEHGDAENQSRAPVVVFLGHVDHGKTSLMDRIRKTSVVDGEAGGITQHIGAYRVKIGDHAVTFLDTPGHEAFTAMRARGAQITDIAVLVVAADDGVMPQTEEAINHAKAAEVPIVVAMNKVDLPSADVQRVFGQLAERDLVPEEWGGKTIVIQTSATTGQGIEDLLEALALEAELLELKADPTVNARGVVIEAEMREGLGTVMTLLVQEGTLRVGDLVLAGSSHGRVRAMIDDQGRSVEEAGASMPVSVSGLSSVPGAGDEFFVMESLQKAREFAEQRERKMREQALATRRHVTLEDLFEQMEAQKVKQLNVILKADVQGSVEVLKQSLNELKHPEVEVAVLHAAVGGINESDVLLADASDAVIIGFHVVADDRARALAETKGVDVRLYSVIYQITDDLRNALEGMLDPEVREDMVGRVVVRQTFKVSRLGTVVGCYVTEGVIRRNCKVRVSRQGIVMYEGELDSLKRFKDDAREVTSGLECGLKVKGYDDIKIDDVIEAIERVEVKRTF